jgi:hypothetical protein
MYSVKLLQFFVKYITVNIWYELQLTDMGELEE